MDGAFTCPECGSMVEVRGLSPGRQTRCDFCLRLVEIPFIPRAVDPSWRRVRFQRSPWLLITWCTISIALIAIIAGGVSRLLADRSRSARLQTIEKLIQSATQQSDVGSYGLALIDLDSAIELLESMGPLKSQSELSELKRKRGEIARSDAQKILKELHTDEQLSDSAGSWLNLRARILKDSDLAPFKPTFDIAFQSHLVSRIEREYQSSRELFGSRRYQQSLESCFQIDRESKSLPPDLAASWQRKAEETVQSIALGPGIVVAMSEGKFLFGSGHASYTPDLLATVNRTLREKGYIPAPVDSPWRSYWARAPFRLELDVIERQEGNYQASQNRLARIEVHVILMRADSVLWKTTATARSHVPMPGIPASVSNRLAISSGRIDEFERLLYENARSMINSRLAIGIEEIPPCPNKSEISSLPG